MRQKLVVLVAALMAFSLIAPAAAADTGTASQTTDTDCEYPIELTDAHGETITLEEPPESVVTVGPSDTQTVFEIGAEDTLVGMPDNPAVDQYELGDRTAVTDDYEILHEQIVELDPDVVLAANATFDDDIETLRDAGLDVYHFDEANSIDDVYDIVEETGQLTGECEGADETVDWMDDRLDIIADAVEGEDRPLAYYAMGADGTTPGTETFLHDGVETAGLENLGERAGIQWYAELSEEDIVDENPEWIIHGDDADPEDVMPDVAESTTAYQEGNVLEIDASAFNQPAPQVVYAIVDIVEEVHPDAYEEAAEGLEDRDDVDTDDTDDTDDGDADDTIPGFGVPAVITAALVAAGFLARRR
ncbi:PGF-CTERM-anchored ABC transporter substrate-binding protein [Natronolimnohabitans sp. A-GB9]|uniref:PGF-CTERM-anchored ABC transporter substrate-binding protein n=1 Tax=Natronolimnohabitans sp. A-GB9 TaxID=3069757 RepID=UPI0027ADCA00|nr:PGF-CTERM-anchored ABC transporter substrate-binding protein [Natronolimnohabitans sp. A-GB9]MDQ2052285.1 PGF-CTERM-anchored ABC transporter substrate-binding protein [Natronolimnohabitans sp. A-GB9]